MSVALSVRAIRQAKSWRLPCHQYPQNWVLRKEEEPISHENPTPPSRLNFAQCGACFAARFMTEPIGPLGLRTWPNKALQKNAEHRGGSEGSCRGSALEAMMRPAEDPPRASWVDRQLLRELPNEWRVAYLFFALALMLVPSPPLGIMFYFCLYKTQEDMKHIIFIKVLRAV